MGARVRPRRAAGALIVALAAWAVVGGAVGPAQAQEGGQSTTTFTTSTRYVTTEVRVDLDPAPAPECDAPGAEPTLVDETVVGPTVVGVEAFFTIGPATIYIGENEQTPFEVLAGQQNVNTRTTYETVVTRTYQATEPGPPCAAVLAARFTG